jgi:MFS family permease
MPARQQFSKDPVVDRALRHSVRDGMAYSVMAGGGETYLSAFALFLRATAPQIALLSTLPPLLGSLAQLFSAWLGTFTSRKRIVLAGCSVQALLWLPILLVPLVFDTGTIPALLVLLALYFSANNFAAPQWTSLMRDLVSERRRGRYFGHRTRLTTITTFAALVICGLLLHWFDTADRTYLGFVIIFLIAFAARSVSVYHLTFMHEPPPGPDSAPDMHIEQWWRGLQTTGALGFSAYVALMSGAVGISSPFFTVYMLRDLGLSYFEFTLLSGTSVFVQFLSLRTWGRVADVYGNRLILMVTSISLPVIPVLWLISDHFWYLIAIQGLSGLSWSGFTLCAGNLLYEIVPTTRRAAYVAFHNVGTATAVFAGAMLGALLVTVLPPRAVLFGGAAVMSNLLYVFAFSGGVRAIVATLLARRIRDIRKPRKALSAQAFVLRVIGLNTMAELIYDLTRATPEERGADGNEKPAAPSDSA